MRLLDPACGRGTTLNRAIVYGLDAVGVEHDQRDVEAYEAFLLGWLKDKRLKHEVQRARLRKGRTTPASPPARSPTARARTARPTVPSRSSTTTRRRSAITWGLAASTCWCATCPTACSTAPPPRPARLRRSPEELLEAALPAWREVLRPGAGVALAWNLRTLPRAGLVARVEQSGLELCVPPDDARFAHRVDRTIQRDVVVARRPAG